MDRKVVSGIIKPSALFPDAIFFPVPASLLGISAFCARGSSVLAAASLYSLLPSNSLATAYAQMYIDVCESLAKFQQNSLLTG